MLETTVQDVIDIRKSGMQKSGLYIVMLKNEEPISVNANDPRIANTSICVTRVNCKIGKMKNLAKGQKRYSKVFGEHNVIFNVIAFVDDAKTAERLALRKLDQWRLRGRTNRKNEWLAGIAGPEVEQFVLEALKEARISFEIPSMLTGFPPARG